MRLRKAITIGLLILSRMAYSPIVLSAEDHSLVLSIHAVEEFNDNLDYSKARELDDLVTTLSPKIQWTAAAEKANASISTQFDRRTYWKYDELDQTDQTYSANGNYRASERFSVSAWCNHVRDSLRERDIETTGLVLADNLRIKSQYGLSGNYLLSEKDVIECYTSFENEDFEDIRSSDSDSWNASLSYARFLDTETRWSVNAGYAAYDYDQADIGNYWLSTGGSRKMSESVTLDVQLGGQFTRSEQRQTGFVVDYPFVIPVSRIVRQNSSGLIGNLKATFAGDNSAYSISMNHDVGNASGRNGTTLRTAFVFSANRRLTDAWFFDIAGGYYINQAEAGELATNDIDERSFRIQPRIQYRINRHLSLDGSYRYTKIEDGNDNSTVRNSAIMLQIGCSYDVLE